MVVPDRHTSVDEMGHGHQRSTVLQELHARRLFGFRDEAMIEESGKEIAKIFADAGMPILRLNRLEAFPGAEWEPKTKEEWIAAGWTEIT